MNHRYYKAMKLAGAYAFCDGSPTLDIKHLEYAIQLVEDSGQAFKAIMKRDRNYVRIAKYLSDIDQEVTQVDLMEDVPAYKGSASQKSELMQLAVAWGYKNNIIIKYFIIINYIVNPIAKNINIYIIISCRIRQYICIIY